MADGHMFNNISLVGRGGNNPGQLRVHSRGLLWKKQGGGKAVEVDKSDIVNITWMKVPRSNQLSVLIKDGLKYKFVGFRVQDVASLTNFFQNSCNIAPEEKQLSVSGKNWGELDINGNMLSFLVGGKQSFEVSLADVSQTQLQAKTDVILEFHVDDTTGANEKDSLMELTFYVPNSNPQFVGDENRSPAEVFREKIMSMADVGTGGEGPVVTFESIQTLTPRGRSVFELHLSFLRLHGSVGDFKIQYSSIVRVFVLPKAQPHTFVVITLDPPIRKGNTMYPHIVTQFDTDNVVESTLVMNEDLFATKYKDKLEPSYKGLTHEVFTMILRGLSGTKLTRPGKFRSFHDGYAVKSSLKAEDGVLYPLEKSFFFLPKPPTLILHDEIEYVEFERHSAGGANMQYFDFLIKLKTEQEHLFRNIQRSEYHNLYAFIRSKPTIRIMNLGGAAQAPDGVAAVLQDEEDDAVDPHLERIRNAAGEEDSDEEDEDFVADKDDDGSPSDDSGDDDSNGSGSGSEKERVPKKESKKKPTVSKVSSSKKRNNDEGPSQSKKQKKKKDPNAPKKALSGFMFFSQLERENIRKEIPGISFKDIARVLGERWNKMTAEEKEPYEAKALADKKRYQNQINDYQQATKMDLMDESDSN
uniref:FACT complex subunit SSRP1-like isoform X2 n=1 Tax=Erigeron canadensis TaxID=72917 RepID=UPI001CB8A602|nr:FACT complex subunit SSRP1-like isoform X2 [Erigeron canadensis]